MDNKNPERVQDNQIYQAYGLALHWAQLFEAEIINSILFYNIVRNKFLVRSEVEAFLFYTEKRPLRQLLRELLKHVRFEPDVTGTFIEAIEQRNFLVHKYFWDRMDDFVSEKGRDQMLKELRALTQLFYSAHHFAFMITKLYAQQLGISDDAIKQEMK